MPETVLFFIFFERLPACGALRWLTALSKSRTASRQTIYPTKSHSVHNGLGLSGSVMPDDGQAFAAIFSLASNVLYCPQVDCSSRRCRRQSQLGVTWRGRGSPPTSIVVPSDCPSLVP